MSDDLVIPAWAAGGPQIREAVEHFRAAKDIAELLVTVDDPTGEGQRLAVRTLSTARAWVDGALDALRPNLRFDFGSGTIPVLVHEGVRCVQFADLCRFVGGDYEFLLREVRGNGFAEYLCAAPDGGVLFHELAVPAWVMLLPPFAIAPEHRDDQRRAREGFFDSDENRALTERLMADLFPEMGSEPGDFIEGQP